MASSKLTSAGTLPPAGAAAALPASLLTTAVTGKVLTNWAATKSARPGQYFEPADLPSIQAIVRDATRSKRVVKVIGAMHSPNDCAISDDVVMSLRRYNKVLVVDIENGLVKVQAGITLAQLNERLDQEGLAMPNLGSISEQSIAGAIATGTHGTGVRQGILATSVVELQLVLADGSIAVCSRKNNADMFYAALCSFGCLGVVTGVVLSVVPAFDLRAVESPDTLPAVLANLRARITSAPFYRFWWFPHTQRVMEWRGTPVPPVVHRTGYEAAVKHSRGKRVCGSRRLAAAVAAPGLAWAWLTGPALDWLIYMAFGFYLLEAVLRVAVAVPLLIPVINRVWSAVLFGRTRVRVDRSDRVFNINCLFKQHVNEWAIPLDALPVALAGLSSIINKEGIAAHFPIEVRFVAGDPVWLSPCYVTKGSASTSAATASGASGEPSPSPSPSTPSSSSSVFAYIGIIMYRPYGADPADTPKYFRAFEELMLSYGGRPHWAKDFAVSGDAGFGPLYPRWADFKALRARVDPSGTFANAFVRRTLGLPPASPPILGAGAACGGKSEAGVCDAADRLSFSPLPAPAPALQRGEGSLPAVELAHAFAAEPVAQLPSPSASSSSASH